MSKDLTPVEFEDSGPYGNLHICSRSPPDASPTHQPLHPRLHRKTRHHITYFFLTNISFHVAAFFVLGSVSWVVNGFYAWPLSSLEHATSTATYSALAGGILFEIGAWAALVEASNVGHPPPDYVHKKRLLRAVTSLHTHHYFSRIPEVRPETFMTLNLFRPGKSDIGYWASLVQFIAATVFGISVITGIPTTSKVVRQVLFWLPQVIGGCGFIVASWLYWIEAGFFHLERWAWHVAVWNLVGSVGFMLSGLFGFWEHSHWGLLGVNVNNFYGGWAFLIGSLAQLMEVALS